jgi:RimJ/RimL family protein N-acetyltransferase
MILRRATLRDSALLLAWRNDPETRKASHSMESVAQTEHHSWLKASLSNPNRKLFIAEVNGIPVGTVRADYLSGEWTLSWTTAREARKRGVAREMVALLVEEIREPIRAEVKAGNVASSKIAELVGMQLQHQKEGVLYYRRAALTE